MSHHRLVSLCLAALATLVAALALGGTVASTASAAGPKDCTRGYLCTFRYREFGTMDRVACSAVPRLRSGYFRAPAITEQKSLKNSCPFSVILVRASDGRRTTIPAGGYIGNLSYRAFALQKIYAFRP